MNISARRVIREVQRNEHTFHAGFFFTSPSSFLAPSSAAFGSLYVEMYFCSAVYSSVIMLILVAPEAVSRREHTKILDVARCL